jgi:hypothetical protein
MTNCCPEKEDRTFTQKHTCCFACHRLMGAEPGKISLHDEVGNLNICYECGEEFRDIAESRQENWPKSKIAWICNTCLAFKEDGYWVYTRLEKEELALLRNNHIIIMVYACPQCEYKAS